jgi:hypothetical protein
MRTGRPRKPAAEQQMKGDPRRRGARKLAEDVKAEAGAGAAEAQVLAPKDIDIPAVLTKPREREIYAHIMGEFLPRNIARQTDAAAYARYAHYLADWEFCKLGLEAPEAGDGFYWVESKHGKRLAEHPLQKRKHANELALVRLELQLGLTPLSRQSIVRGMGLLGAALGGLFSEPKADAADENEKPAAEAPAASPLGFLAAAVAPSNLKN